MADEWAEHLVVEWAYLLVAEREPSMVWLSAAALGNFEVARMAAS